MNRVDQSFIVIDEPAREAPVVVSVPHAGEVIPDEVAPTIVLPVEQLLPDIDLGVDRLCANASAAGATLMATTISRFVVDLNRHPDDLQGAVVNAPSRQPPVSYGVRGLVWAETTRGESVLAQPLTDAELQARVAYYHPYHAELSERLRSLKATFGRAVLVDVHSMPSRGAPNNNGKRSHRPDIILGDNLGKACDAFVIDPVEDIFRRAGYSVVRNRPYRGGYITRHYGAPRRNIQAIQIEINRKLYMDEQTLDYDDSLAEAVQAVLTDVFNVLVGITSYGS